MPGYILISAAKAEPVASDVANTATASDLPMCQFWCRFFMGVFYQADGCAEAGTSTGARSRTLPSEFGESHRLGDHEQGRGLFRAGADGRRLRGSAMSMRGTGRTRPTNCEGDDGVMRGGRIVGRETPTPDTVIEPVNLIGTRSADTIRASGHVPREQAGHMTCTRPQAEGPIPLAIRASSTHVR